MSGTFFNYMLPENLKFILYYNPYYYVVNFFRNCFNEDFIFQTNHNIFILFFIILSFTITAFVYLKGYNIINIDFILNILSYTQILIDKNYFSEINIFSFLFIFFPFFSTRKFICNLILRIFLWFLCRFFNKYYIYNSW